MNGVQQTVEAKFPKLSICIATRNRGDFIGQTLDSIVEQIEPGVELVIVDGASTDNAPDVIARYAAKHPEVRYHREPVNCGVDQDYDKAVGYAAGEFCWLMTDDDLLRPGAIETVLACIDRGPDLVIVNAEVRNADFSKGLGTRLPDLTKDKEYGSSDSEAFFREVASHLSFIGCVIVRRKTWLERDRATYYGSLFVHVGVIFQHPPIERVRVVAAPLIAIRYGNAMWMPRWFEIWSLKWPELIWSFEDFSDGAKFAVSPREPWKKIRTLLLYRAMGGYTKDEYRRFLSNRAHGASRALALAVAIVPGALVNAAASVYVGLLRRSSRVEMHDLLVSRYATGVTRLVASLINF